MSADNGIYILKTRDKFKEVGEGRWENTFTGIDAYRVAHASAIDNLEWYENNQPYNVGFYLFSVWGDAKIFYNEEEAVTWANRLAKGVPILEYGVVLIERLQYEFPH